MDYYELSIRSESPYAFDILTAALAEIGFESFDTDETVLKAYIQENIFNSEILEETFGHYQSLFPFQYIATKIENQNWNAVWESGFQPVVISKNLRIRAAFHPPDAGFPYEIIIQPKMSFGTGHHATTHLVLETMLSLEFNDKKVLDFGTGTGILAILAHKMGAEDILAIDNDPQCIENASENFIVNGCDSIQVRLGGIGSIDTGNFDIIIANITRNTILENFEVINLKLQPGGLLIASGFYEEDLPLLNEAAVAIGLVPGKSKTMDKWCTAIYKKG